MTLVSLRYIAVSSFIVTINSAAGFTEDSIFTHKHSAAITFGVNMGDITADGSAVHIECSITHKHTAAINTMLRILNSIIITYGSAVHIEYSTIHNHTAASIIAYGSAVHIEYSTAHKHPAVCASIIANDSAVHD